MTVEPGSVHIGTMGWTYRDWSGTFYARDADRKVLLQHYARVFGALEIDSTFHYIPRPEVVTSWRDRVPDTFRFTAKLPGKITHERGLVDTEDVLTPFLASMALLGDKLGCLLVQLPPGFRCNNETLTRVEDFLKQLPARDFRFAFEFRHGSWIKPEVFELLETYGVAWTMQDHPRVMPIVPRITADFTYIRWMGDTEDSRIGNFRESVVDRTQELIKWAERLKRDILPRVGTLYGFFNNYYSGHSPADCNRMKRLLGLDTVTPDFERQLSLF